MFATPPHKVHRGDAHQNAHQNAVIATENPRHAPWSHTREQARILQEYTGST